MEKTIEIPIQGMDCTECTLHVQKAISSLPGIKSVDVFLSSEKAIVQLIPEQVNLAAIRKAVEAAGYSVPFSAPEPAGAGQAVPGEKVGPGAEGMLANRALIFTRQALALFAAVFGLVLFVVVVGEGLGLFKAITARIPWPLSLAVVLAGGYPVFRNVIRAALRRQVISHTLMTLGVVAAIAVGEWATAAVVVLFMRVGDFAERATAERARRAVRDLTAMAPQKARLERGGAEVELPVSQVQPGETVIVRPGEKIPVDGEVLAGQATVDQAAITGEAMPVEAGPGTRVFAATLVRLGSLRLRAEAIGADSTFGRVIRLVEQAEGNRASVQRVADRFSAMYLPVVAGIAALTLLLRRDPLAAAAVLVVACSCSFALATPIAVLASIGAAARRGLLIKGGKYIEALDRADVLLIDKTGTLTLGKPEITEIVTRLSILDPRPSASRNSPLAILQLAASAERYSEHPLAEAVRQAARQRGVALLEPEQVEMIPGMGVRARVAGVEVVVGNRRMVEVGQIGNLSPNASQVEIPPVGQIGNLPGNIDQAEAMGKTILYVSVNGELAGFLAAADTLRPEVPAALRAARQAGIRRIELLTGDNERTAASLAQTLAAAGEPVPFRANLLPEDKIAIVREYQAQGHRVIMVGDGITTPPPWPRPTWASPWARPGRISPWRRPISP